MKIVKNEDKKKKSTKGGKQKLGGVKMLTYNEYINMGGTLSESDFPILLQNAIDKIDFYTFGKFSKTDTENSKKLLVKVIGVLEEQSNFLKGVKSYGDGIETITYDDYYTEKETDKRILTLCKVYLQNTGLLYRGSQYESNIIEQT